MSAWGERGLRWLDPVAWDGGGSRLRLRIIPYKGQGRAPFQHLGNCDVASRPPRRDRRGQTGVVWPWPVCSSSFGVHAPWRALVPSTERHRTRAHPGAGAQGEAAMPSWAIGCSCSPKKIVDRVCEDQARPGICFPRWSLQDRHCPFSLWAVRAYCVR